MKNLAGFTLIETLIAAAGAAIIGTMLLSIWVNNNSVFYKQNSLVGEGLSLNAASQQINGYTRQASAVVVGFPESAPVYTTGASVLVLKLPATSSTGPLSDVYDYIVITPDSSNPKVLRLLIFPDSQSTRKRVNTVLTALLEGIEFSYLDQNGHPTTPASAMAVGVQLTVLQATGSIGSSQSSNTVTTLRNFGQ